MTKERNERLMPEQKRQLREHHARYPNKSQATLAVWAQKHFSLAKPPSKQSICLYLQASLTADQKRQIRACKTSHPTMSHSSLAAWSQKHFKLAKKPSLSNIGTILKTPGDKPRQKSIHLTAEQRRLLFEHKMQHPALSLSALGLWAQNSFNLANPPHVAHILQRVERGTPMETAVRLTDEQQLRICDYKAQHPTTTASLISTWAHEHLRLTQAPSIALISRVLKRAGYDYRKQQSVCFSSEEEHKIREWNLRHPAMSVAPVIRWTQKKFNLDRPPGNAYMRRILEGRSSDMSKRKNVTLSDEQKRQVCKHKEQYPAISLPSLALWAKKQFCLVQAPSPQSISSALIRTGYGRTRHRCEYLKVEEENQIRERKIKCPNTNRHKLASWAQVQFNLGRPLSLKYLQSILEPLEDTPRRPRACLTAVQRRQLCQYKAQHPESTLPSLAIWAQKEFSLPHPPSLSGVHLILKVAGSTSKRRGEMVESDVDQDKDEEEDESSFGVKSRQRNRSNGSVVLERALAYFIVNHTIHRNIKPTLDDIMDKGQQFAEALGLGREDVSFSRTWFTSFYQRHGLTHGITNWNDKESVLIYLQVKELSVQKLLLMASKEYADGDSFDGQGALDETDVDEVSDIEDSDELHSVFSDIDVDMGDADDDDEQEDEQEVKQEDGQEVKQKDEQGVKEDAKDEQDVEMKFEARETGGPHAWSLKEKIRALFVVIPLLDPFDAQQKEAYTVLNDLYIRFQILGLKQEPIDATAGDWTREKRESLSIIMALLDPSVESHRSTYTILNQENEKLSCGE